MPGLSWGAGTVRHWIPRRAQRRRGAQPRVDPSAAPWYSLRTPSVGRNWTNTAIFDEVPSAVVTSLAYLLIGASRCPFGGWSAKESSLIISAWELETLCYKLRSCPASAVGVHSGVMSGRAQPCAPEGGSVRWTASRPY